MKDEEDRLKAKRELLDRQEHEMRQRFRDRLKRRREDVASFEEGDDQDVNVRAKRVRFGER